MKKQIYFYKLFLFSSDRKDEGDFIELNQEQGQKLAMALASNECPKYILIDEDIINTSAIEELKKVKTLNFNDEPTLRELTTSEIATNKAFQEFKNKTLKLTSGI